MGGNAVEEAFKTMTYGVYIIGTAARDKINGMTAAWVTRVSVDPPLLLAAISKGHYTSDLIRASKAFSVNLEMCIRDSTKVVDVDTLPSVAVLEPFGGEAWMGSNEIRWTASDTDTSAEDLIIKLEFSSDRGETWKPIMDRCV